MSKSIAKQKINGNRPRTVYITKRLIISSSTAAVRKAAARAMQTAGYVIKAHNGWIIRENKDGSTQKIKKYRTTSHPAKVVLD